MVSHYHYLRKTKRACDEVAVKAYGPKTWGYDYANDGNRNVINYRQLNKWLESQAGRKWDDVWADAHKKWNNRTYVGKETIEHIYYCVRTSSWSEFTVKDGILVIVPRKSYRKLPKRRPSIVYLSGRAYIRKNGLWFEVQTQTVQLDKYGRYIVDDIFLGYFICHYLHEAQSLLLKEYGKLIFCVSKQQVGKRICRKLNVISLLNGEK